MRPIIASRRARALTIVLALAAFGCGGDGGKATGPATGSGNYTIESINASALPFVESGTDVDGPYSATFAVACCSVVLGADGSYTRSLQTRFVQGGIDQSVRVEDRGKYSVTNGGVRFISSTAMIVVDGTILFQAQVTDTTTATLNADRLSMVGEDGAGVAGTFVFRRQ